MNINIDVNHTVLVGTVKSDPSLRRTQNNKAWISFRMVTQERYRTYNGEDKVSETSHNVKVWGQLAERMDNVLYEGSRVYVEGKNMNESWTDQQTNEKKWNRVLNASKMFVIDAPQEFQQQPQQGYQAPAQPGYSQPAPRPAPQPAPVQNPAPRPAPQPAPQPAPVQNPAPRPAPQPAPAQPAPHGPVPEDDLPF